LERKFIKLIQKKMAVIERKEVPVVDVSFFYHGCDQCFPFFQFSQRASLPGPQVTACLFSPECWPPAIKKRIQRQNTVGICMAHDIYYASLPLLVAVSLRLF
jgi:hypothetical protein